MCCWQSDTYISKLSVVTLSQKKTSQTSVRPSLCTSSMDRARWVSLKGGLCHKVRYSSSRVMIFLRAPSYSKYKKELKLPSYPLSAKCIRCYIGILVLVHWSKKTDPTSAQIRKPKDTSSFTFHSCDTVVQMKIYPDLVGQSSFSNYKFNSSLQAVATEMRPVTKTFQEFKQPVAQLNQ